MLRYVNIALLLLLGVGLYMSAPDVESVPEYELQERVDYVTYSGRSSKWPSVRAEHIRSQPVCACCGSSYKLNVHHILPFHVAPERELDLTNLITLCYEHHLAIGHDPDGKGPQRPSWKKHNPNVVEDCKTWLK